ADRPGDHLGGAVEQLQGDVAGAAVGDDDVDAGGGKVAALDAAGEADPRRLAEQAVGLDDLLTALARLLPHRQQPDRGVADVEDGGAEGGAEEGELDQVLGADLDVGADVEEEDRFAGDGDLDRQGGPLHAL